MFFLNLFNLSSEEVLALWARDSAGILDDFGVINGMVFLADGLLLADI